VDVGARIPPRVEAPAVRARGSGAHDLFRLARRGRSVPDDGHFSRAEQGGRASRRLRPLSQPVFHRSGDEWGYDDGRSAIRSWNMLRSLVAVSGGGPRRRQAITGCPQRRNRLHDGFARRIARNKQLILLEESNLAKVADPTAVPAFRELKSALARPQWALVQRAEGGRRRLAIEQRFYPGSGRGGAQRARKGDGPAKTLYRGPANFRGHRETPPRVDGLVAGRSLPAARAAPPALHPPRQPFRACAHAATRARQAAARAKIFPRQSRSAGGFHGARPPYARIFEGRRHRGGHNDGLRAALKWPPLKARGAALAMLCCRTRSMPAQPKPRQRH